jgi:hypothetical protein
LKSLPLAPNQGINLLSKNKTRSSKATFASPLAFASLAVAVRAIAAYARSVLKQEGLLFAFLLVLIKNKNKQLLPDATKQGRQQGGKRSNKGKRSKESKCP